MANETALQVIELQQLPIIVERLHKGENTQRVKKECATIRL